MEQKHSNVLDAIAAKTKIDLVSYQIFLRGDL
jgi:hypothetical protein